MSEINLTILQGDCREKLAELPDGSVNCCVTSPPYFGLRDYGMAWQIGLEPSPDEYVAELVGVFREVRRVLRDDGTLWLNLGDSYANDGKWGGHTGGKHAKALHCSPIGRNKRYTGLKPKDLIGIPWRVAFALQADGWYLRQDIIWSKPNPMPESVEDRCTKSHEYVFMLSKSSRYFYDHDAIKEPATHAGKTVKTNGNEGMDSGYDGHRTRDGLRRGVVVGDLRNRRSVWTVNSRPYPDAHFATYPPELIKPCILAGCPAGGVVLDPFAGSGTTGKVALELGRSAMLIELNPEYIKLIEKRCRVNLPLMFETEAA